MKRLLIMLLMVLSLVGMVPGTVSAEEFEATRTSKNKEEALEKIRNLFNNYVDPDYYLEDTYYNNSPASKSKPWRKELHTVAESIVKDSSTQYDKIKAITMYVANRVYYSAAPGYEHVDPYDVYQKKTAACAGYASLVKALCDEVGIPCATIEGIGLRHLWNAAYDSEQKRWIFLDATWCSNNRYWQGEWIAEPTGEDYFDYTSEKASHDAFHLPYWVHGITERKNDTIVVYQLNTVEWGMDWNDYSQWDLQVAGMCGKHIKLSAELENINVTEIYYLKDNKYSTDTKDTIQTIDMSKAPITRIHGSLGDCINLTSVKFPSTLKQIDAASFLDCYKLKEIDLSNTQVSTIGLNAFRYCNSAKTIKLPSTVKKLDMYAFAVDKEHAPVWTTLVTKLSKKQLCISEKELCIWEGRKITNFTSTYTIRFIKNGAKKGKMADLLCERGSKVKLPANKFRRPGYKFKGWSTVENGKGKIYKNRAKVKNIAKANEIVKLYACWKKIKK